MDPLTIVGGISALGSVLGGAGGLIGGLKSGSGNKQQEPDYASLYANQLIPGNVTQTAAATELATMMAPYTGAEAGKTKVLANQAYDQFQQATAKESTQAGLQAGVASQYASSVLGNQNLLNQGKLATEMMGTETAKSTAEDYRKAVQSLEEKTLAGEAGSLAITQQAMASAGLTASQTRNKQVDDLMAANLDIAKKQEDARNTLAVQRGQYSGQQMLQREQFGGQAMLQREQFGGQAMLQGQRYAGEGMLQGQKYAGEALLQGQKFAGQESLQRGQFAGQESLQRGQFSGQAMLAELAQKNLMETKRYGTGMTSRRRRGAAGPRISHR